MKRIKRRGFLRLCGSGAVGAALLGASNGEARAQVSEGAPTPANPVPNPAFVSVREDGRFIDSAGFLQAHMKANPPKLAFNPEMALGEFPAWRDAIREKMRELLAFPEVSDAPPPRQVWEQQRDGYRLQKWEAYPEPYSVVTFLLLIPEGISAQSPAPAVLCFPGSSKSKESLAGEPELDGSKPKPGEEWKWQENRMAFHFVKQGFIACAVDNPAMGEHSSSARDYQAVSACAIWTGRSYLGISVFQKAHILEWLGHQDFVDAKRVATCGHSLGSDPADALGVLYPELVNAVIHNDFCCDWRERAIALGAYPGGLHHVVPGMFAWYDAPDLQASLAPRPLLYTEGGRTPHLNRVRAAYRLHNAEDQVEVHYYKKYATADLSPLENDPLPEGVTMEPYFEYANVDPKFHCFRPERAIPWLAKVSGQSGKKPS